ncbi:hypothetical protein [Erythrobacter sp.]|uniref:hypothetical protein n=1 Tax=Erythrobacter sp. TaxID=1042 RepID=UPI001B1C5B01|nr:hypothetical protein [Erythrobacter sp.]MBO6525722.1 hypothetical protein [Erythrobacter sp.]MBO6529603.1 hypothetical protein [Erythrobacter sp.]
MHLRIVGAAIVVTVLAAAPTAAQSDSESAVDTPAIVEELFDCREIADPDARLACFDREVAKVYDAQSSRQLVIADREQVREARKGLFGFTLPKLGIFGGGDDDGDEEKITEIASTLTDIRRMGNGRYLLTLESGAQWMQTDSTPVLGNPSEGDEVVIKRAALGSYMAKIDGGRAIRVKRTD